MSKGRFPVIQLLTALFALCFISSAWAAPAQDSLITAESEGVGLTRDEALTDARRNAVQQAVGVLSEGVTESVDDRVLENIVQVSRAFIEKYDILDERRDGARWRIKIKAWIRGENILNALRQKDPDKSPFDGAGLFVSASTREQKIREASEMLIELFGSFPYKNYVLAGVSGDSLSAGQVNLRVRFSFDRERYFTQAVPFFSWALGYVAEAAIKDVPFMWELKNGNPIVITPPSGLNSLSQYMEFMEIKNENRYIDIPGAGDFANIYLLKKNYYFDCYRVPAEAFAALTENMLAADKQNRLTGIVFEKAALKIAFKNESGAIISEHSEPLNLHNVMLFANPSGLKRSPYVKGKPAQLNEQRHALFILPCLGTLGKDAANYLLIENDIASISAKLSPKDAQQVSEAECSVEMRR